MARVKPPANAPYPRLKTCHRLFAGWMRSVPRVTGGADVGKSCGRAQVSVSATSSRGSARLATEAMDDIGTNCAGASRPSNATSQRISCPKRALCCDLRSEEHTSELHTH